MRDLPVPEIERAPKPRLLVRWAIPLSLALSVLSLLLFVWLADEVFREHEARFDLAVRQWVHQRFSPALTRAAVAASFIGQDVLVVALIVALIAFLYLHWRRASAWLAMTMAGALVLDLSLKFAFHRTRPQPFFGPLPPTYSFPSGHALFSFCFYGVLAGLIVGRIRSRLLRALIWLAAALLIAAIGLSRIYLGVHYPTDVLAGYLAGAVWVSSMIALDHLRFRRAVAPRA